MNPRKYYANRPLIYLGNFTVALPFMQAKEVSSDARLLLAMASNFRLHGANLYKLVSNKTLAEWNGWSVQKLQRMKKQLNDAKLLTYDGSPGNYNHLIEQFERITGEKYGEPL